MIAIDGSGFNIGLDDKYYTIIRKKKTKKTCKM